MQPRLNDDPWAKLSMNFGELNIGHKTAKIRNKTGASITKITPIWFSFFINLIRFP